MYLTDFYAKAAPLRLFFTIAIPSAVSMIASSLWGVLDGMFVGNILGETAFAALNLAFPFVLINFSLADLIGVGSSISISIALGQGKNDEANNFFSCACLLILATGIWAGAAMFAAAPLLIHAMGAQGELADMAIRYTRTYALASPLTTMVFAVDNYLRICGKIKGSMALNIVMSALILLLEYVCLSVLRMDICGSALAVSGGMFVCTLIALYPFVRKKLALRFCRPRFSSGMIRRIVAGGSPNFLSNVASRLTSILMNVLLLQLGGPMAISVYGVLMYVGDTLQQLLYGACDGMQPAIGYNWGAGCTRRVRELTACCMAACAAISLGGAAGMLVFPELLSSLFIRDGGAKLLALSAHALRLYSLTFITRWLGFAVQSFLAALDIPLPAAILSVLNALVLPVALLPLLWPLGLDGLWLNTPIVSLLVSLLALVFGLRLWRNMKDEGR